MVNGIGGHIAFRLLDVSRIEVENRHFAHCVLIVHPQQRDAHLVGYISVADNTASLPSFA